MRIVQKKGFVVLWVAAAFLIGLSTRIDAGSPKAMAGEVLFKEHCAVCHPNGGNIVNPGKTLHRKSLEANGVKNGDDIIARMRHPGPGMTPFDEKTLPDEDARTIAEYILKTFE